MSEPSVPVIPPEPTGPAAAPTAPPPGGPGAVAAVAGTFSRPGETFAALVARPTWWLPFILWIASVALSIFVATPRLDMEGTVREAFEKRAAKTGQTIPEEVIQRQVKVSEKFAAMAAPIGTATTAVVFFIVAAALWGAGRAVGGENSFTQTLAVWSHANLPNVVGALVSVPIFLAIAPSSMTQRALQFAVQSNVGAFLPEGTPAALLSIAASLDVFSLAALALLVIGFRRLPGLSQGAATAVPVVLWAVYVAGKTGWAALFS